MFLVFGVLLSAPALMGMKEGSPFGAAFPRIREVGEGAACLDYSMSKAELC